MKKFLVIIIAVVLCAGLLGGYVWYRNIYIYQPKGLTVEFAHKDVTAEFVGTRRMVEHLPGEIRLNGRLYIDEDWYPIDVNVASKNSSTNAYLYNEDGTYYGTARVYWNAEKITVYRLEREEQSVEESKEVLELEKS